MTIKKIHFIISLFAMVLGCGNMFAQQLTDPSFENWGGTAFDGSAQLKYWNGSNVKQTYMGIPAYGTMVTQATGARTGSYCAQIQNDKVEAAGIGEVAPAWLTLGTPFADISNGISGATAGTYGGIAFTYRPDTMAVWIKRTGGNTADEDINLVYYSWIGSNTETSYMSKSSGCVSIDAKVDEESDIRIRNDKNACATHNSTATQVAEGWLRTRVSYSSWTLIKVPINYYTNDVPQKMNIILSAANYPNFRANSGIYVGNALYVDDISLIYSSKIHELYINNRKWGSFSPDVYEYTYALGVGATEIPSISARRSGRVLPTSEVTITNGTVGGSPTIITVKAQDGSSSTTYKIYFVAQQSTNARLAGISVNGTAISNFNSYVTSYNVALPYGTTVVPEIAVTKAEDGQTYEITNCSSLPGTATIKVYAEDKSYSQTYTLNFTVAALTDNTLQDILINNKSLTGFAPTKTTYVVEMPVGTTTDPTITPISAYEAGAQTIVLDNQGLNGKSTIKVTPTGATNTRTYNITYKITESSYSYLKSIKVGGETLPNFAPETTSYTYTLPIGTTSLPEITWEQGDDYQTVTKEEGGIDGVTKITVTAQNGTITIYRITFITLKSSVATLTDLQIDGTTIAGFDGNIFTYNYELPIGTTALPAITWTAGDAYQTINIIKGDINGTTKIIVKAQNGTTNTYNIIFSVAQADNTTLTAITIGGVLIPGFTPTILEYNYVLPRGTTVLPEIGYTQHDEYQTVIVRKGGLDGDTKITVKAQTGVTADYTIHFSVEISSNGLLQNIFVDGMALANFDANQFTYTYELPIGTTTMPAITYLRGDEYQTVTVTEGGLNGITEILVTSEDKLQKNTYRITFSVAQAGVSTLLDLQVGGVTIEGFQPEILEYSYVLPRGTTVLPTITCVAHDAYQTIRQSDNGVNGDAKIIVRAQTGAVSTYVIHFSVEKSNNSQLSDIQLNGVSLEGFESTILNYVDTLTSGTTELPEITVTKGDNYQTVYITKGGVNGTTTIRVVAENGSETIYAIAFSVRKSENAFLKNILIDGIAIAGFDKTLFDYTYILDASAVTCPTITVEKEEGQSVVITKPNLIGTAMIVVTPEFGANNTYTIKFKLNQSSNTALADLTVGGTTIAGFDPTILNYTYVLPNGTATLPNIGYVVGDVHQAVNIIKGNVDDTTYIHVVAEDGAKALYSIAFSVQKAESAVVNNIMVNGMSLSGFNDTVLNYTYELPKGTLACPTIEVVKAEEGQTVYITKPNLEGIAYITVIPEVGLETIYQIVFTFNRSNNSFLDDLTIDGTTVTNFRNDSLKYTIQLPNGTTELPAVAYTKGEEEQTVAVFSNGVNGTTVVTVKAEDGTVSMYKLAFSVVKSTDATLQSLKIDGVVISDFRSDSLYYVYTLPTGTAVCPTIEAVVNHSAQNITVVTPKRDGTATIIVTAENGTQQIYTVEFVFAPMSNVNLAAITVDNAPLATFDAATINYIVDLPAGASAPNIGFVAADSTQMISIIDMDLNGTQILVTAQNGNQKVYSVTYNVALSNNALLQDLQLYNGSQFVSIADFAADKFNYCDTLAWRTATVPAINPVSANKGQIVTIAYNGVNDTATIHVVAEDGIATADYAIAFPIRKSAVTTLSNLMVEGAEVAFDPAVTEYTVTLPYGTAIVPNISWTLGEDNGKIVTEQRVQLVAGGLRDTTILTVTAENGAQRVYKIAFEVAQSTNDNVLTVLIVEGIGNLVENTTETTFDISLPYRTTILPAISYTKSYPEQTVLIDNGGVYAPTTITVKANKDGVADKVYVLNPQVAALPTAVLKDVKVNGTSISGFRADKYSYVVAVSNAAGSVPTVEFVAADGADATNKTIENTKQVQVEVTAINVDDTNTSTYNVYFYYTNDVIPNGEFTSWTTAKYNSADKPTGWNVPADKDDDLQILWVHARTGSEVFKSTNSIVGFKTTYWSNLAGAIPALATIGDISCELKVAGKTTADFSGGINYRNTPDFAKIRYKYSSKAGNGALFAFRFGSENRDYTTTSTTSSYTEYTHALNTSGLVPSTMNIAINATNQTSGASSGAELYVDYIRFTHSSKISQLLANGTAISGFNGSTTNQTLTVDSDLQGVPTISAVGEVPDQEYTIDVAQDETQVGDYKTRTLFITSKAEDGTSTDYTVTLKRALSSNKQLAGIAVNGISVESFAAGTYTYSVAVPNGTILAQDIAVVRGSMHQTVAVTTDGINAATIRVTAENGATQDYTINFVEAKSNVTALQNITVSNHTQDFTYDAATYTYSIELAAGADLPTVTFDKNSDGQTVILSTGDSTTVKVVAENGVDEATYAINFTHKTAQTNGQLLDIAANSTTLTDFAKTNYEYALSTNEVVNTYFEREVSTDEVIQTITRDSVMWDVTGTLESHTYKLKLNKVLSANVDLGTILVDGDSLADFNAAVYEYVVNTNEAVSIEAKLSEFGQTLTTTFSFGSVYSPAPVGRMSAPVSDDYLGYFTFTVTSADGLKNQTTTVALKKIKSTNADLATIMLDGEIISTASVNYTVDNDFDANTIEYNISIPSVNPKTAEPAVPNITIKAADNGQVVVIEKNPINQASYITVTAENGNEKVYTLNITSEKSSNADLTGIAVNYVAITDFRKDSNHYVADLDKAVIPIISYTVEDYFQQGVKITTNKDSAILVVTAENGNKQTYVVTFNVKALSNNANLSNIVIGNTSISGFAADTYVYNVDLAVGTENLPVIEAVKGHDGQTIEIADNGVNGATTITVTAEDMVTQQTYTVNFSVIKSTNAYLENIAVNYQSVADFVKTTFNYAVVLDNAIAPTVAYTCGDVYQTVSVQTNIDSAVLIVTAQDGITVNKYVINFTVAASSNANLADILLDGVSLSGFRQDSLFYHVQLPVGTTLLPDIAVAGGADGQTINITNNGLRDTTYIVVTAEDGVTVQTYSLSFDVEKSDVDTLKMIYLNGVEVLNYDAQASQFDITLPVGTRRIPFITYDKGYPMQTVVLDTILMDIANYAVKIAIKVTSEKGNQRTYLLNFTIDKSTIDTLKMIYINYEAVSNYKGNTLRYDFKLPVGTRVWPTVTYDKGDTLQTVKMDTVAIEKYAAQFNLTVTAESGSANIYELHFGVDKSVVDTLKMLRINNAAIALTGESYTSDAAFAGQTFAYHVEWAIGTRSLPRIDWIAGDSLQQVSINKEIETLNDTIVVTVKAENGNEKTYTIYNKLLHSEVDTLKMIYTNSEALENFEPRIFNYDITLPVGTRQWPTIDFDKGDHWQTVSVNTIATSTYVAVTKLEVTAEDSIHKNVYTLNFTVEKSVVDTLKGIYLEGMPLEGFDASIYTYNYLLPYGTVTLPNITWEAGDIYQVVDTVSNGVNGDFVFTVTAENGSVTTYTIHFGVEKSHNANLEKILVDGTPLVGFDADISEYLVKLPYGTVTVPVITYEKAEANQQVELTAAATLADTTVIKVVAEDNMTIKTYKLHFEVLLSDNALLENIFIGGVALTQKAETFKADEDFAPENFSYNIGLPFGTTVLPEITWVAQVTDYDTIYLTKQATLNGTSTITVVSQDKMNTNEYELTFSVLKSNNNSLQDLLVDGVTIEGFHPDTLVYSIEYPVGTDSTQLLTTANISYVEGDSAQTVVVSQTDPMVILITVTAGNGDVNVYVIEMTIKLSDNSLLKKIFLDGVGLKQFSPTTFEYEYLLFAGNSIPEITVEKGDEKQEVYITMNPIGEFTYIFVEAEDKSVSEYKILFKNSTESTTTEPSEEDVCWTPIGNGTFKASTRKDKVKVAIFHTNGRLIDIQDVPLVDPNDVICDPGAAGVHFHFEKKGDIYICVFYYEGKKIIKSEKFLY